MHASSVGSASWGLPEQEQQRLARRLIGPTGSCSLPCRPQRCQGAGYQTPACAAATLWARAPWEPARGAIPLSAGSPGKEPSSVHMTQPFSAGFASMHASSVGSASRCTSDPSSQTPVPVYCLARSTPHWLADRDGRGSLLWQPPAGQAPRRRCPGNRLPAPGRERGSGKPPGSCRSGAAAAAVGMTEGAPETAAPGACSGAGASGSGCSAGAPTAARKLCSGSGATGSFTPGGSSCCVCLPQHTALVSSEPLLHAYCAISCPCRKT